MLFLSTNIVAAQTLEQWKERYENAGKTDEDLAMKTAKRAAKYFAKIGNKKNEAFFYEKIAKDYQGKSMQDSALYFHFSAINIYENLKEFREKALILNEIGRIHRKLENQKNALRYYDEAFSIFTKLNDEEGKAIILNESGVVFEQLGNHKEAQKRYRQSLEIQKIRKDSVGIGYSLGFIGYNFLVQNKLKESEDYLLEALKIRKLINDEFALTMNYNELAELFYKTRRWGKAELFIKKSDSLSRKINYPDIRLQNFELQINNAKENEEFQKAFLLRERQIMLKDSLYSLEKEKNIEALHQKFDTAEKEKALLIQRTQIAENELDIKNKNILAIVLSFLALFAALLGYFFFYRQKLKNRQQKKESELKIALKIIENKNALDLQRLSISRDLHDNIGSQLTFIISSIDTTKQFFGKENLILDKRLSMINTFTRDTILELRDTIWAMNRSSITIEDLQSRISNFINNANVAAQNIEFRFENLLLEKIPVVFEAKKGMNIYRILQESINNAIKHAEASEILVHLFQKENQIIFSITDNGKGFEKGTDSVGNGLKSMEKRAEEISATLEIKSSLNGTKILLNIPL
ncbi:tetratricopeptide repeat-containing sensor histidine kinase [Frigoriflavimonas asaccharolytica]|uniref:tetratricopeptide repeat-containing sensor histidine kinase n=1 Tax=Frigoriflavimonas asaccharolytica TaxID=2735899 RepID=UPI001D02A155|nr:tetratricopeptide repeat protein [Frigoriflavimonas asaccharolytica]